MKLPTTRVKQLIKDSVYSIVPPPAYPASFSQAGEDAVLRFLFADRKMRTISYLDVGANCPDAYNNTYLFYKNGSRGVCVEADKTLIPAFHRLRPEDKILNVGVTDGSANEAEFYIFDAKALNTFDKEVAQKAVDMGTYKIVEKVR